MSKKSSSFTSFSLLLLAPVFVVVTSSVLSSCFTFHDFLQSFFCRHYCFPIFHTFSFLCLATCYLGLCFPLFHLLHFHGRFSSLCPLFVIIFIYYFLLLTSLFLFFLSFFLSSCSFLFLFLFFLYQSFLNIIIHHFIITIYFFFQLDLRINTAFEVHKH